MSNVFNPESTQTPSPAPQGEDVLATKLSTILNEEGQPKYANVETALDALKHSQEFIPSLKNQVSEQEAEIARLREQVAKQQGVQEALERFGQQPQAQPQQPEATPTEQPGQEDIASLVQNTFESYIQNTQAEKNFEQVQSALVSQYGDKASDFIATKAKELNTTTESLEEMAKTNPTMALHILGTVAKPTTGVSYGGTNTTSFGSQEPAKLERPAQSLLSGASDKDKMAFLNQIREEVYREHGITN